MGKKIKMEFFKISVCFQTIPNAHKILDFDPLDFFGYTWGQELT
jgi:hypothetical protein